jgi:DNA invertase Pin-like site-specific DNA recombinase
LENQRTAIVRWADERGFTVVVDDYVDDAISGTSATGRPAFLRMIEDAKRPDCPFRHILVYDTKRFSRGGPDEAGHYRHILRQHGVTVHCVAEGFTGGRGDNLLHAVYDHMAREDSVGLSRVTIGGQVSAARKGLWNGGMPPYGYDLNYTGKAGTVLYRIRYLESGCKQMIDPDGRVMRTLARGERISKEKEDQVRLVLSTPERVALVREIFDMCRRGMGYKSIAAALNERGIPSPKNGKWSKRTHVGWSLSTIRSILVNPIYLGAVAYNRRAGGRVHSISMGEAVERDPVLAAGRNGKKIFTPNPQSDHVFANVKHDPIIDRATWEAVGRMRASREKSHVGDTYRGGRAKTSEHVLSGLIRCPRCGHIYGGMNVAKAKRRVDGSRVVTRYYICSGYRTKGPLKCTKLLIPAPALENGVMANIEQRVVDFMQGGGEQVLREGLAIAAKRWLEQHAPDPKAIEERLQAIRADVKRLLASITPVNAKYLDEEIVALQREREALEGQLEQIRVSKATAPDVDRTVDEIVAQMQDFQAVFNEGTPEEKKEFIRLFVEGIELDAEKRVARCRIKKFPAPSDLDAGKLSFGFIAGARVDLQKTVFPPVEVVEIPLVTRGTVLVPVAA